MERLNREQARASRAEGGISLVLAGAGTGKTRTLVEKARAVVRGLPLEPEQILVLTFSRRAAEELRDRIAAGPAAPRIAAHTFHSFCLELLRRYRDEARETDGPAGFPAVLDDEARDAAVTGLVMPVIGRFQGLPAGVVRDLVLDYGTLDERVRRSLEQANLLGEVADLSARFRELKRARNMIDYGDMICMATELLARDPRVRGEVRDRYRYLFVDEFQDTSDDNIRLIRLLLPDSGGNLFAVGDDWQSIYGFRRARVDYILNFRCYFPGASVHHLTLNYRSRREIVRFAVRFARRNRSRTRKRLVSARGRGGRVETFLIDSADEEIGTIRSILGGIEAGSAAVLYRNNWQGRRIRERLGEGYAPRAALMTMHAAKGLEFDSVIVAGVADGVIPDRDNDLEEERRLLYVACTRARDRLFVIGHRNERGEAGLFAREIGCGSGR